MNRIKIALTALLAATTDAVSVQDIVINIDQSEPDMPPAAPTHADHSQDISLQSG